MWDALELVGDLLFLGSAIASTTFAVLYALRSNWRATPAGRVTLGFMAVVAAIMDSAILFGVLWPDSHEHERLTVRVVLYGLLFGGCVHLLVILLRAQRADRRERAGRHRSGEG